MKLWEAETGKELASWDHPAVVRNVDWAHGGKMFVCSHDSTFGSTPTMFIFKQADGEDIRESHSPHPSIHASVPYLPSLVSPRLIWISLFVLLCFFRFRRVTMTAGPEPILTIPVEDTSRVQRALFSGTNEYIVTANTEGLVRTYDVETGKMIQSAEIHSKQINDLQWSWDKTMLTTASSDETACLLDPKDLSVVRRYQSNRPLNGCVISPIAPHILLGGGQEAISVTMTRASAGHFEVDFFSAIYGQFQGSVHGHFGPVNALAISPDGKSFASGSEDGYIRLHHFDQSYLDKYARAQQQ